MSITLDSFKLIDRYLLTNDRAAELIEEITLVLDSFFKSAANKESAIGNFKDKHHELSKLLGDEISEKSVLAEIVAHLRTVEVATLTLSFEPSDSFLKKVQILLEISLAAPILFEIKTEHSIVGGFILQYKGKRVDMSTKNYLDRYFVTNKNALLSKL